MLVRVDVEHMLVALAAVMERPVAEVEAAVFTSGLKAALDVGRIGPRRFWQELCRQLQRRVRFVDVARAYCDLFSPIAPTLQLLEALGRLGHRRYLLTNTDPFHLESIRARWPAIAGLDGVVASFAIRRVKPDPGFFVAALRQLELEGCEKDCVFLDDRQENVEAARRLGIPSIHASSPEAIAQGLQALGVRLPG